MIFISIQKKKGKTVPWLLATEIPEQMGAQEAATGFLSLRVEGEVVLPHHKFLFTLLTHYL